jgi:hypothetical protein
MQGWFALRRNTAVISHGLSAFRYEPHDRFVLKSFRNSSYNIGRYVTSAVETVPLNNWHMKTSGWNFEIGPEGFIPCVSSFAATLRQQTTESRRIPPQSQHSNHKNM